MKNNKQQKDFYNNVWQYLKSIGASPIPTQCSGFRVKLNTIAGDLEVSLHEPDKSEIFSIYCKFKDEIKAFQILGNDERLNTYSGKWNFHNGFGNSALNNFKRELIPIL